MKKMVKRSIAFFLSLALAIPLFGCNSKASKNSSSSGKTTLTFLTLSDWPDEGLSTVIKEYEKENPNVAVKLETYSADQLSQIIEVKLGTKSDKYDVVSVDAPKVAAYTQRGYLLPMDKYFTADEKKQLTNTSVATGSWQGKFMAPPMDSSSQLLFYNKDLLKAAGVAFPSSDVSKRMTYEEVLADAEKVQKAVDPKGNKGIYGFMLEQVNMPYQVDALPNSLGGKCIGSDVFAVDGVINTTPWIKAMTFYSDLFNKYKVSGKGIGANNVGNYFRSGKVAFLVGGTWNVTEAKINFGYTLNPYFKDGKPATPTDSWHFAIAKNSKHADEAAKFIKYMSIGKGADRWFELDGIVPSKVSLLTSIQTDKKYKSSPQSAYRLAAYEEMHAANPRPVTPGYSEWEDVMKNTFEDIRNGEAPAAALNKAVSQINTAMTKYKK